MMDIIPDKKMDLGVAYLISDMQLESNPKEAWAYAKREMIFHYMKDLFPAMIDDGLYHVMKFDFYTQRDPARRATEYRLICKHSIAQVENIRIPNIEREIASIKSQGYQKACRYCGNVLIISQRGACNACGAPAGDKE